LFAALIATHDVLYALVLQTGFSVSGNTVGEERHGGALEDGDIECVVGEGPDLDDTSGGAP
jgi:hypothetical protein